MNPPKPPTIYVPKSSAKARTFPNGGTVLRLSFNAASLVDFVKANTNAKGYINIEVRERREPSQYGDTHSISLDTWEPTPKAETATPAPTPAPVTDKPEDDVPF